VPPIAPTSISTTANNICAGNPVTLTVNGGSLGTGATWEWYSGSCGGTHVGTGTSITVNPIAASTTYFVRAEGAMAHCSPLTSCAQLTITTISAITNPIPTYPLNDICLGQQVTLPTGAQVGGSGDIFIWYSDPQYQNTVQSPVPQQAGTFNYYGRWVASCGSSAHVVATINVNASPSIPHFNDIDTCAQTVYLSSLTGTNITFQWYNMGGTPVATNYPLTDGQYHVIVTDILNNCTASDTINVTIHQPPTISGFTEGPTITCLSTNSTLEVNVSGGTEPYSFVWSGAGTGSTNPLTTSAGGNYIVHVTDFNQCTISAFYLVNATIVQPNIIFDISPNTTILDCSVDKIAVNVSSPSPLDSLRWDFGHPNSAYQQINEPGTYSVTIYGSNGCTNSGSIIITQNKTPPQISVQDITTCEVDTILPVPQGFYSVIWYDSNDTPLLPMTPISTAGDYVIVVTGYNHCVTIDTITVNFNGLDELEFTGTPSSAPGISDGSATVILTDPENFTILWSNDATTTTISDIIDGVYTVTVTSNGCSVSGTVTIGVNALNSAYLDDYELYPTVTNNTINILFKNKIADRIVVLNANGQFIRQFNNIEKHTSLHLEQYGQGQYYINIYVKDRVDVHKIIIIN
jgi:hypothetical protein